MQQRQDSEELLKFLHDKNITPGIELLVIERLDVTKTVVLRNGEDQVTLPFNVAEKISVIPLQI